MTSVTAVDVPRESSLYPTLAKADFFDSYRAPLRKATLTPAAIFLAVSRTTPGWIDGLMVLRNAIVRQIGLKDVGHMGHAINRVADDYGPGDRFGIFTVLDNTERELLLGIDDSHLDVRVSVAKNDNCAQSEYAVSTAVYIKNWVGRLYMLPVSRIHPFVVRAMMKRANV